MTPLFKNKHYRTSLLVSLAAIGTTLAVFAQDEDGTPATAPTPTATADTQREIFIAQLAPVNAYPGLNLGAVSGTVRIVLGQNRIGAIVEATGLAPQVAHEQHIHSGTQCADLSADQNSDGFIDAVEGAAVSGAPVVPLDTDMIRQGPGEDQYPLPSFNGNLTFITSGTTSSVLSALSTATPAAATPTPGATATATPTSTPTSTPTATASPATASDTLEGRVVEIHGVNSDVTLPSTVQSMEGMPATETLPVACGTLIRVAE